MGKAGVSTTLASLAHPVRVKLAWTTVNAWCD